MEAEFPFQNEKKYRWIFRNNPQPMLIYNTRTLCVIEANKMASTLYGYTIEEFLEIKITSITNKLPHLLENQSIVEALQLHRNKNGENILVSIKGTKIPFPQDAYLILSDKVKGHPFGKLDFSCSTITTDKLSDTFPDVAQLKWLAEKFFSKNQLFLEGFNFNEINDFFNKTLFDLLPEWLNNLSENAQPSNDVSDEKNAEFYSGFTEWINLCEAPLKDSLVTLLKIAAYIKSVILYRSAITTQVLSGRSRKGNFPLHSARPEDKLNNSLVKKIAKQTKSLNRLKRKIKYEQGLNVFTAELISSSSHHFRTPLAIIYSSAEILELKQNYLDNSIAQKHIDLIKKEVNDLTSFLDEILALARNNFYDAGPELFRLDIEKFCNSFIEEIGDVLDNHQVICSIYLNNSIIISNSGYLKTIFDNIISNAVKYSPPGNILIDITEKEADIIIAFTDNGIGIPPENIKHIFKPFFRGNNAGHIKGSGLGLSIVKKCTDALGGKIQCKSMPGRGTIFTLVLPRQSPY